MLIAYTNILSTSPPGRTHPSKALLFVANYWMALNSDGGSSWLDQRPLQQEAQCHPPNQVQQHNKQIVRN